MTVRLPESLSRHREWAAFAGLLLVYLVSLAPSVTLWDSGEFLAAIRTLGTPHPPGTPLFVYAARVWSMLAPEAAFTVMVNVGSAVATAGAVVVLSSVLTERAPRAFWPAVLLAGTVTAVWQSATETEVYGYALLLSAFMLRAGHRAGRQWSERDRRLLAFLFGLAVPLHLSALVVGPAAIWLAATDAGGRLSLRAAAAPAIAWSVALGVGVMSRWPLLAAVAGAVAVAAFAPPGEGNRASDGVTAGLLALLGASFILVMLVRASHDPGVNAGYPTTWEALRNVVARAQYDVPPLWPRRAPAWLQAGNLLQYADWQFAFGVDGQPGASWWRTPVTLLFAWLAVRGAQTQWQRTPRVFSGHLFWMLLTTVGVVAVLNLRAGPSYGWGILPPGALREARERDYFFAPAFAGLAIWSAIGLSAWCDRHVPRHRALLVAAICALPLAGNWRAMDRRRSTESLLSEVLAFSTLRATPPNSVLLLAGDNDAYAVWWAQYARQVRPDVTSIVVPMLPATWYREELRRRAGLDGPGLSTAWRGREVALSSIAASARRTGRPLVVGVSVPVEDRMAMGDAWRFYGLTFVRDSATGIGDAATDEVALRKDALEPDAHTSPAGRYVMRLLQCPAFAERAMRGDSAAFALLESACNYR